MELLDHLIIAKEFSYISLDELNELRIIIEKCNADLNGYIKYLLRAKKESE